MTTTPIELIPYQDKKTTKYKIMADTKSYSEWSVNSDGSLNYCEHQFEGHDLLNYKIVPTDDPCDSPVFESESWQETKAKLLELNK